MGRSSDDFDLRLTCGCGHEETIRVVTPLPGSAWRTCPQCGAGELRAEALPATSSEALIEEVDYLVKCAIGTFRPVTASRRADSEPSGGSG